MPTTTTTVITRRTLDFTNIQGTEGLKFVIQRAVDVTHGTKAEILVRVHEREVAGSAAVGVVVCPVSLTPEEPQTDFSRMAGMTTIPITASSPASVPGLLLAPVDQPYGSHIQILVGGLGDSGATNRATISVDLVIKD